MFILAHLQRLDLLWFFIMYALNLDGENIFVFLLSAATETVPVA